MDTAAKGRSRAKLAAEIPLARQTLHVYEGQKPCPAWVAGRLAEIAGGDPITAVLLQSHSVAASDGERAFWKRMIDLRGKGQLRDF